jgi:glycosyltransferase involved in cell wall biosynthesis
VSTRATEASNDGRRLLVITYYFDPNGAVGGLRWLGITKYLARLGWKVSVVTAAPPLGDGAAITAHVEWCPRLWTFVDGCRLIRRLAFGRPLGKLWNGSRVAPPSEPPRLLRQLGREFAAFLTFPDESRGWILRAALRTRSLIRRFRPQVVVSSGPPHSAHLVAGMATIGSAVRWLIDLRDPWAGPFTKAWERHPRIGARTFRALSQPLERLAFRTAHGVITNTHQLAQTLATRYPDVPVVCVPNGVDPECLPPPPSQAYPGLGITYAGMLYGGRDLRPVVRALRIFLDRHPEAADAGSKLRLAGPADSHHAEAFNDVVGAAAVERHVEILGRLSRAEALNVVSRSRLAVVLAQEQELQIPAKLYESVAMGVPTLVVAEPNSAAALEGERVGAMVYDSGDVEGIACVLERLWRNGSRQRSPCPVPITYEAIAPFVDQLLRNERPAGLPPGSG